MLQLIIIALVLLANLILAKKIKDYFNPVSIMSVFFFIPMLFSSMRLSTLQSDAWFFDTKVMLIGSFLVWGLVPLFFLTSLIKQSLHNAGLQRLRKSKLPRSLYYIIILLSLGFIVLYLLEIKIISGTFIPILHGSLASEFHTASLPLLGIVTRAGPGISGLLFVSFYYYRRKLLLLLLFISVFLPVIKAGRVDILLSIMTLLILNSNLKLVRFHMKNMIFGLSLFSFLIVGLSHLGNLRAGHMGKVTFIYSEMIGYKGYSGPADSLAWVYGYFALPFENFDRFVRKNQNHRVWGLFTFQPLFNSLFELDRFLDLPTMSYVNEFRDPVTESGVGTSLSNFYMDFGVVGGLFSMLMYMFLWLFFYAKKTKNPFWLLAYSLYSSFFVLAGFQARMLTAGSFRMLLFAALSPIILHLFLVKAQYNTANP